MKRYLIHHDRSVTWDLIEENGQFSVERYHAGKRERLTIDQFERSSEGKAWIAKMRSMLARARAERG